jgi:outer membrane receptor protein involved in Fe transport
MFMDDRSVAQIAPSGDFATNGVFDCANPLMSGAEASFLGCTGTAGTTDPSILILRRDVEGGNRQQSFEHMDFREVIGLKGKLDDVWSYDASFNYSLVNLNSDALNYFSSTKLTNALNVTGTAANPSCVIGPPCVPYNLFGTGPVTPAQLAYLYAPGIEVGRIQQYDVNVNFTGDLGKYGVQIPTANSGLQVNVGAEYRDARSSLLPDEEVQSGDLSGSGGPTPAISGGLIAREGFFETRLPVMDDQFLAKALDVETGYRYSSYDLGFSTNTYKIGIDWAPVQDVRLRGSFARASRAPNVVELYNPASVGLDGSYTADPCAGTTPTFTAAQCAKTGVLPGQYGHIAPDPAGQYNGLLGGNEALKPETALTTSFGIGFTPQFLPNFRAQFDYYNINIQNVISQIGGANILTQCATSGVLCNLINRGPGGTLWTTPAGFITDTLLNVGDLLERGLDADIAYSYDFGAFGKLHTNLVGTYIDKYQVTPIALSPGTSYNCSGYYGPTCSSPTAGAGTPVFRWRHRFTTTWETPWSGLDMTLAWRFYSSVKLEQLSPNSNLAAASGLTIANGGISNTDAFLASYSYFDITASMKVTDKLQVRLGVNNVLDKAPPIIGTTNIAAPPTGNGNTFPGVYDSLGRYLFAEVTAQF